MDMEELYDKIYRFCYYRVLNRDVAEDLTQETFLRFFKSDYQEQGMRIRYLYTIARNLCIEESRKQKFSDLPEEMSDEGALTERLIEKIHIQQALMELPEDDRDLLIMRYLNGESISDICRTKGQSRFAIYRRLIRIKKRFLEVVEGEKKSESRF